MADNCKTRQKRTLNIDELIKEMSYIGMRFRGGRSMTFITEREIHPTTHHFDNRPEISMKMKVVDSGTGTDEVRLREIEEINTTMTK